MYRDRYTASNGVSCKTRRLSLAAEMHEYVERERERETYGPRGEFQFFGGGRDMGKGHLLCGLTKFFGGRRERKRGGRE